MLGRLAGLAFAGLLAAACAGGSGGDGMASLWVTRNGGARVILLRKVAAGQTAMQALERAAEVETSYGGRFVQSINGIRGSLAARTDWFWFVNGIEGDRSAAEYRLRPGDVEWWDFRSWARRAREPVVVGAFPEPFLHGYGGRRRPAAVRYADQSLAGAARAIARLIRADSVAGTSTPAPREANLFLVVGGRPRLVARPRFEGSQAGDPVTFTFAGDAHRLAREPELVRRRYRWP